jgi:hypothetical protein
MQPSKKHVHSYLKYIALSPGGMFDVEPCELDMNVGRRVRFIGPYLPWHGTLRRNCEFVIRCLQKNYRGEVCYRVHAIEDGTEEPFGCVAVPSEVEFVD